MEQSFPTKTKISPLGFFAFEVFWCLTSGCTSSTKQTVNSNQNKQAVIRPTIQEAPAKNGVKTKSGAYRFRFTE